MIRHLAPILAAAMAAAAGHQQEAPAAPLPQTAPVVRPGAPGQPSRDVAPPPGPLAPASGAAYTKADVRFMQEMIHHHAQAIEMVTLLKTRTARDDLKLLGRRIEVSQTDEIRMMKAWLADRGEEVPMDHGHGRTMVGGTMMTAMPGMLTPDEMAALEKARGPAFDRLFLAGMIRHHEGALAMVAALLEQPGAGQESVIFDFITHVDADQRMEIARMRQLLTKDSRK